MELPIVELDNRQVEELEGLLEDYDKSRISYRLEGKVSIGVVLEGKLAAGADACMTAFHILYVSTVFVREEYRGQGIGKRLMGEVERRARALGANLIRLDTFDWQGRAFYRALGYEEVGSYRCEQDGFSEHFFLKRLTEPRESPSL